MIMSKRGFYTFISTVVMSGFTGSVFSQTENLETIARASVNAHEYYTESDITMSAKLVNKPYVYGVPDDDFEFTAVYAGAVLSPGEANGFDIFNAVDPGDAWPGTGLVTSFDNGSMWDRITRNSSRSGRFILGDHNTPYYLGTRTGDVDNDFAYIIHLVAPATSEIVLHGGASDYQFVAVSQATGPSGTAIFYDQGDAYDMIGFILDETDPSSLPSGLFQYTDSTPAPSSTPSVPEGIDQFGGPNANLITGVKVDDQNNVYAIGVTREDLPGAVGSGKLFAVSYNNAGQRRWLRQFGCDETIANQDYAFDMDIKNGSVYIAGRYYYSDVRQKDAFIAKLDSATGAVLDDTSFDGPNVQFAGSVAADDDPNGYVYIAGIWAEWGRPDPFMLKIPKNNLSQQTLLTTEISSALGGMSELWGGMVHDRGTVYATGWTLGSAGGMGGGRGRDAWVAAVDAATLNVKWIAQWGAVDQDWAWDVDVDAQGYVYAVGHTYGKIDEDASTVHHGGNDGFLVKLNPADGDILWVKQIGTTDSDSARSVCVAGNSIYVSGHTYGDLVGQNRGFSDAWAARFGLDGTVLNQIQIGTDHEDRSFIAANADRVALGGFTQGSMVKANAGWLDAWLIGLTPNLEIEGGSPPPPPNQPPVVTLTEPTRTWARAPATITMAADASDPDGSVAKVEFLVNGNVTGTDTAPPYAQTVSLTEPGTYTLEAKAYDNEGATTVSEAHSLRVFRSFR